VVVGASGLATWNALRSDSPSSLPKVVSSAKLRPLPAKTGRGTAQVTTTSGRRELSLDVQAPTPHNAFLEVWLMSDPDHLVSLGTLDSSTGSFALPAGINLDKYSIVDVSIEPYDGNPAHSSDSLVRGTLDPS
jgi:anti-sigma-K factor RskA